MTAAPSAVARHGSGTRISPRRRMTNVVALGLCVVATVATLAVLVWILSYVFVQGARYVNVAFFTELPAPVGEPGGGFLNALVGTGIMVGLASAMSIPVGVLAGIYLAGLGRASIAGVLRFANDMLNATPSIVAGLFAYTLIVLRMHRFSAIAGSVALAVLMVPTITRTTEEMIRLVPRTLREGALALGVPEWRTTLQIVLRAAAPGILTGVMLAVARVSGETAALLFTAFGNRFLSTAVDQPMGSVPVQVYTYAVAPYDDWHHQAWAGAFVLLVLVAAVRAALGWAASDRRVALGRRRRAVT